MCYVTLKQIVGILLTRPGAKSGSDVFKNDLIFCDDITMIKTILTDKNNRYRSKMIRNIDAQDLAKKDLPSHHHYLHHHHIHITT